MATRFFPPTHSVDDKNKKPGAKYAFETRRIEGQDATLGDDHGALGIRYVVQDCEALRPERDG